MFTFVQYCILSIMHFKLYYAILIHFLILFIIYSVPQVHVLKKTNNRIEQINN